MINELNQSNPENIVSAPKGSVFTRLGDQFYLLTSGRRTRLFLSKKTFFAGYGNEALYGDIDEEILTFKTPGETWIKTSGSGKTGWTFLTSKTTVAVPTQPSPILGDVQFVAAGAYFSHFLKTNGDLYSAGENYDGQIGVGSGDWRITASLSLTNVKTVAAGSDGYFAGAVKNDNTLWFTGTNGTYQFGNNTTTSTNVWTETVLEGDITGSGTITSLVAGAYYSALLMEDGTVWVSTNDAFNLSVTTFTQVASDVKYISGGVYHLLYIKSDDTLWGIGENGDGQLGDGDEEGPGQNYYNWDEPYQIASNVTTCAAMGYHSAYVDSSGVLWTFGNNSDGQLGIWYNYLASVYEPQQIDTDVKFVGGGYDVTYYIKNDGTLYGMGYAGNGELGNGYWDDQIEPVVIDTNVKFAVGGNDHGLFITNDNTLYGMGYNYYFQLTERAFPFAMFSTDAANWTKDGITKFNFIATDSLDEIYWRDAIYADGKFIAGGGEGFTRVIYSTDGKTWMTGSIDNVEIGLSGLAHNGVDTFVAVSNVSDGYNDGRPEVFTSSDGINWTSGSLINTNYNELNAVTYGGGQFVAVGSYRIVTSPDGISWTEQTQSFGANLRDIAYGEGKYVAAVDGGDYVNYNNRNTFINTFTNQTASAVSLGNSHAMLIKDGTLYGCGYNGYGQVGLNVQNGYIYSFIKFMPITTNVRSVACGKNFTTFVKNDDTLWGMGQNDMGQLGDGTRADRHSPIQIDTNVSKSFAGSYSTDNVFYVKNDGTLWGIGGNAQNQLSSSATNLFSQSIQIDTDVVKAGAGDAFVLYLKTDGTLWGRGYNYYGQLGTGDNSDRTSSYQIDSNVIDMAVGGISSYYIKNDGGSSSLFSMGYNAWGQLGVGDTANRNTPTYVTSSAIKVAASYYHASFISDSGTLYSMGHNEQGALGVGDYSNRNVPTLSTYNVVSVSCGQSFTYIIQDDGSVLSVGNDDNGRLGLERPANKNMYSTDGITWVTSSMPNYNYTAIAYGNGKFVAVTYNDSAVVTSEDGVTWSTNYLTTRSYADASDVIFDGTKFVVSARYSDEGYNIFTSTDGSTWTPYKTGYNQQWGTIAYGDGKYVLLSDGWQQDVNPQSKLTIE